jgi:hypothetical protein
MRKKKMSELMIPRPEYESVDIVLEFSNRFQRRKELIYTAFNTRRKNLEAEYEKEMKRIDLEESQAISQLHLAYVGWINIEPPDIQTQTIQKTVTYFDWLRSFWGTHKTENNKATSEMLEN